MADFLPARDTKRYALSGELLYRSREKATMSLPHNAIECNELMGPDLPDNAPLLVCSVFAGGELDEFWLQLQRRQLDQTVGEGRFEHAVYLGQNADERLFCHSTVVGRSARSGTHEHLEGLQCLSDFAVSRQDRYRGFVVLDSDAFPIQTGWMDILDRQLAKLRRSYAAAVRTENLDVFPHPCVVYSPTAHCLRFRMRETVNLLGRPVRDIGCEEEPYLPLLKSNGLNLHPVLATVYSGLFYHHGCGSRRFFMRAPNAGYYDPSLPTAPTPEALLEVLRAAPEAFVAALQDPVWASFKERVSRQNAR